jgi:hypothetical protein
MRGRFRYRLAMPAMRGVILAVPAPKPAAGRATPRGCEACRSAYSMTQVITRDETAGIVE